MLRQDSTGGTSKQNTNGSRSKSGESANLDIQQELSHLEEMILESPRLPLTGKTLVDEEQVLEQLDLVRLSLPKAFQRAEEILKQKQEIMAQAERYAQDLVEQAKRRAAQILDESGIIQHAQLEAQQIRQQLQQECEATRSQVVAEVNQLQHQTQKDCETARSQTIAEITQLRNQVTQEVNAMRSQAINECEEMLQGADLYAERVLKSIEQQLNDMMRVIRNGRQQLQSETNAFHGRDSHNGSVAPAVSPAPPMNTQAQTPRRSTERSRG
jgi:F0F1-type ATP synthase membrane subunit b/b'